MLMFKVFASEYGDQEVGAFYNIKGEMRGVVTDESVSIFNGYTQFPLDAYSGIFNGDNYKLQVYHQVGITYREQVSKQFSFGVKLSALSGVYYRKASITESDIVFDKTAETATISLAGTNYANGSDGRSNLKKWGPSFLNPGASISVGTMFLDESGYKWQLNVKDLGFIHWNKASYIASFAGAYTVQGFPSEDREKNITNGISEITTGNKKVTSFNTYTNGLLELSINKSYWLDGNERFKFSPTIIGSKELFYPGFTAALVAPVQMGSYRATLMSSYNDLKLLNIGAQFMIKKDNSEFFIGSERLFQTISLASNAANPISKSRQVKINQGASSGMDFFIGVSFKFGPLIERQLNSSSVSGERGLIGRTWDSLFGRKR
jgi:hypothetical protein